MSGDLAIQIAALALVVFAAGTFALAIYETKYPPERRHVDPIFLRCILGVAALGFALFIVIPNLREPENFGCGSPGSSGFEQCYDNEKQIREQSRPY